MDPAQPGPPSSVSYWGTRTKPSTLQPQQKGHDKGRSVRKERETGACARNLRKQPARTLQRGQGDAGPNLLERQLLGA